MFNTGEEPDRYSMQMGKSGLRDLEKWPQIHAQIQKSGPSQELIQYSAPCWKLKRDPSHSVLGVRGLWISKAQV